MRYLGVAFAGIIGLLVLAVVTVGFQFGAIHVGGFLNRERADVNRTVFEETRSFRSGLSSNFERHWIEYETAEAGHRQALCASIKRQFAADYSNLDDRQRQRFDSLPNCRDL